MIRLQTAVYSVFTHIDLINEVFWYVDIFNISSFSAVLCITAWVFVIDVNLSFCCHTLSACAHAWARAKEHAKEHLFDPCQGSVNVVWLKKRYEYSQYSRKVGATKDVHVGGQYICTKPQLEVKGLTLSLVQNLEKRLQAATLSPAVFRANILASMFDTLKNQKHIFNTPDPTCQICWTWEILKAPGAQTAERALLQWPPGPPGRPVLCPWCHCWCCGRSAPSLPECPLTRTQPQQWGKPVKTRRICRFLYGWIEASTTGGFVVYLLLHLGQLLVQPTSLRAAGDWRHTLGLGRRATLSPCLPDEFLCSIQNLQNLCGDAAERRCRILLLYSKDTTACQVNNLSTSKKVQFNGKWF